MKRNSTSKKTHSLDHRQWHERPSVPLPDYNSRMKSDVPLRQPSLNKRLSDQIRQDPPNYYKPKNDYHSRAKEDQRNSLNRPNDFKARTSSFRPSVSRDSTEAINLAPVHNNHLKKTPREQAKQTSKVEHLSGLENYCFPKLYDNKANERLSAQTLNSTLKELEALQNSSTRLSFLTESSLGMPRPKQSKTRIPEAKVEDQLVPPKSISMTPARSSSFLFNGQEALYAVNTTNGIIRTYNEDRVSIVINIKRKSEYKPSRWPNCSYFSIFDGHGGALCADFLKDNLHKMILENQNFPEKPEVALEQGCAQAEHDFCKFALKQTNIERSGSCGIVLLIVDEKVYIANVGDSRAIVSEFGGKNCLDLSKDHKPEEPGEKERIERSGGRVMKNNYLDTYKFLIPILNSRLNELPFRLYPGGLSVSRSFGDITAKDVSLGGNPHVLIAKPDVSVYSVGKHTDFIFVGCDGVFDKWDTKEIVGSIWTQLGKVSGESRTRMCEQMVNHVILNSMKKMSYDNLTGIFLNFNCF